MSYTRFVRGTLDTTTSDPCTTTHEVHQVRRARGLPRKLVARNGPAVPRQRRSAVNLPVPYAPRLAGVHDFGDGRHALEFDGPALDLVLYHDDGITIAEWVTVDGELLGLVVVGDC